MNNTAAAKDIEAGDFFKLGSEWLRAEHVVPCTKRATTLVFYRNKGSRDLLDGCLEFNTTQRAVDNIPVMRIVP